MVRAHPSELFTSQVDLKVRCSVVEDGQLSAARRRAQDVGGDVLGVNLVAGEGVDVPVDDDGVATDRRTTFREAVDGVVVEGAAEDGEVGDPSAERVVGGERHLGKLLQLLTEDDLEGLFDRRVAALDDRLLI